MTRASSDKRGQNAQPRIQLERAMLFSALAGHDDIEKQ
jgi:hypothetical protein